MRRFWLFLYNRWDESGILFVLLRVEWLWQAGNDWILEHIEKTKTPSMGACDMPYVCPECQKLDRLWYAPCPHAVPKGGAS